LRSFSAFSRSARPHLRCPHRNSPRAEITFFTGDYLALAKTPVEGPAGVEASFDFRAAFNATATRMMTVVLQNQQAASEYA
jgi:hypothetical protein